jgi:putative ubiquitin-RnfH superfamily antitoxin RatB of RatAB toxin-antitoxin module
MATDPLIAVTLVVCIKARCVKEESLCVAQGTYVCDALKISTTLAGLSSNEQAGLELGVWGRSVPATYVLCSQDRIEVYRPLTVDPKDARRQRFAQQGVKKAGLFAKRHVGSKV